jgi:hypothetical protein
MAVGLQVKCLVFGKRFVVVDFNENVATPARSVRVVRASRPADGATLGTAPRRQPSTVRLGWLPSTMSGPERNDVSDELDEYEDGVERDEAEAAAIDEELALSDADQISDGSAEQDETSFDETRHEYSGAEEGDGDVDVEEMEEAGPLLDDPEKTALRERAIDDPDGRDGEL